MHRALRAEAQWYDLVDWSYDGRMESALSADEVSWILGMTGRPHGSAVTWMTTLPTTRPVVR
jgi:hypothetical protein